jgi:hypothetical protein
VYLIAKDGKVSEQEPTHNFYWYKKKNCRCDVCVAAYRFYNDERRRKAREKARAGKIDATPLLALLYEKVDVHGSLARKMRRWKYEGVDPYAADKVCCELGYHPMEVFGDLWWEGAFDE